MRQVKLFLVVAAIVQTLTLTGQTKSELRELFLSAEVDILYEDYAEALPKYLNLLQIYPGNYNFYFRIGQCYLNTPGEKEKSISFLETAAEHINMRYREGRFREDNAPYDVLYYLANAYRVNNDLDKALATYDRFMTDIDTRIYDTSLVRFQIRSCHVARELMKNPVYIAEQNLGSTINNRFSESAPVVSGTEDVIIFTRALQFYDAVFFSRRTDGTWTDPVNLTPQLGVDQDYFSSSLSSDGRTLLLYRTDNFEGNIYKSTFDGEQWSNVERLNDNVNTKYWESHAALSRDGRKIYFTSNRKESFGGLDIFMSQIDSTGDWGTPVNLGPVINSPYNEEAPFLANDDRTLFFSSRGHKNMGGYDIFRSDLDENGRWGVPVNLGYPVNTTDDDLFFYPMGEGHTGYYARFDPSGYGKMDIFRYEIFNDLHPRHFYVTGKAAVTNLREEFAGEIMIKAVNATDASVSAQAVTDPSTGIYSLRLPHGLYDFSYTSSDATTLNKTFTLPLTHRGDTVKIDDMMLPNTDFVAEMRMMADTALKVTSGDPVTFILEVEPESTLGIIVSAHDSVVISESVRISDTLFRYSLVPPEGDSDLGFTLTDRFGNMTTANISINRSRLVRIAPPQYESTVAGRQIKTLLDILKEHADNDIARVLDDINPDDESFTDADDLIATIKEMSPEAGIKEERIDRLALEAAADEGILTQAATDILSANSTGRMREALTGIGAGNRELRNWSDLVQYVETATQGEVKGDDLMRLAVYILMDAEPGINLIRDRILYAVSLTSDSTAIKKAVETADSQNIKLQGAWLGAVIAEAGREGKTATMNRILAAISHKPGSNTAELSGDIAMNADSALAAFLGSPEGIRMAKGKHRAFIEDLFAAAGEGLAEETGIENALARVIIAADLTEKETDRNMAERPALYRWWWLIIPLLLLVIYLFRNTASKKDYR